jgi:Putative Ig domain
MRQLRRFWLRPRTAAPVLVAALAVAALVPVIVTSAGSATAAASQRPVFTSAPTATFLTEQSNGVDITANCTPACTFSATGTLPPGVALSSAGVLAGMPAEGSEGAHHFTITASNTAGTATQAFTLNVNQVSAIGVEGTDGQLWAQAPQLPPGWQPLGGKIIAPPAVAAPPTTCCSEPEPPVAPVFIATGTTEQLFVRSVTAGWRLLSPTGRCIGAPGAVITGTPVTGPFTLTVACRGTDNALWENSVTMQPNGLPPTIMTSWKDLGGVLRAGPAVAPVNGTVTFFVLGTTGRIYTRTMTAGYTEMPWSCIGQPATATPAQSGLLVNGVPPLITWFGCEGSDHNFWQSEYTQFNGWTPFGGNYPAGSLIGTPALATPAGDFEPVVEGTNHAIWVLSNTPRWVSLGGQAVGGAGAAALT